MMAASIDNNSYAHDPSASSSKSRLIKRLSEDRGDAFHGWLTSYHTFSFADYWDPQFQGFESLRVINEDEVAPGSGFPTHPHNNYEIFSYVLAGEITHKDSMGNREVLKRGHVQFTHAGRGIRHSEFNEHPTERLKFLQIWVKPTDRDSDPVYFTGYWSDEEKKNKLVVIVSPDGEGKSCKIMQDMRTYASIVDDMHVVEHVCRGTKRRAYVHVAMVGGGLKVTADGGDQEILKPGDGLVVDRFDRLSFEGTDSDKPSEFLLFEF
jgi:redox-sensitive bicupin YhaK (pirin superfamily)